MTYSFVCFHQSGQREVGGQTTDWSPLASPSNALAISLPSPPSQPLPPISPPLSVASPLRYLPFLGIFSASIFPINFFDGASYILPHYQPTALFRFLLYPIFPYTIIIFAFQKSRAAQYYHHLRHHPHGESFISDFPEIRSPWSCSMGDSDHHPPWLQLRGRDAKVAIVVDIFCHHDHDDHGHPLLRYRDMMALGSEGWLHNYLPPAANGASEVVLIIMIMLMLVTMGRWKSDDCQAGPNNPLLMKCFFPQSKLTMEGGAGYTGARPQSSTSLSPPSHLAMPQVDTMSCFDADFSSFHLLA